jgi:hypothetical protein
LPDEGPALSAAKYNWRCAPEKGETMKQLRALIMAALSVMAITASFASTASATTIENGTSPYTHPTELVASLSGTARLTTTGGEQLSTCTGGGLSGPITQTGSSTTTVKSTVAAAALTWTGCTKTTHTLQGGELEIHHIAGTSDGTVTGTTFEWTTAIFGVSCTYGLSTTDTMVHLGTLKGDDHTPILEIKKTVVKLAGGFLCPGTAIWEATYHVTSPTGLTVTAG